MKKKLLSIILTLSLVSSACIGLLISTSYADEALQDDFTLKNGKQESLLTYLGVKSGEADLAQEITRAEFADMLAPLTLELGTNAEKEFIDVSSDHPYYEEISKVVGGKLMTGVSETEFAPENKIIYAQALVAVIRLLGLDNYAEAQGGYIDGYKIAADMVDLSITHLDVDIMTREMAYELIYNVLMTSSIKMNFHSFNDISWSLSENKTFLEEKLDIIHIVETLNATSVTAIDTTSNLSDDMVLLGNAVYKTLDTSLKQYLGYKLECFVKINNYGDGTIVAYGVRNTNNELIISSDDFIGLQNGIFQYEDGKNNKKVNMKSGYKVIYNGVYDPTFLESEIESVYGEARLLDNNNDGYYDVLFVNNAELFVVDRINSKETYLISDLGVDLELDEKTGDRDVEYYLNGKTAAFEDISAEDVLLVERSRDKKYIQIKISNKEVSGNVSQTSSDGVEIDNTFYEYSPLFLINVQSKGYSMPVFGKKNIIYLDDYGKISKINSKVLRGDYAWFERIYYDTDTEKGYIQLFTEAGELKNFELKDKVLINGTKHDSEAASEFSLLKNSGSYIRQLVKVKMNNNDVVTSIETANDMSGVSNHIYDSSRFTLDHKKDSSAFRTNSVRCFDSMRSCTIPYETTVLLIPAETSNDVHDYEVTNAGYLKNNTTYRGIYIYDIQENHTPNLVVLYDDEAATNTSVSDTSPVLVVSDVYEALSDEGYPGYIVEAYVDKVKNKFFFSGDIKDKDASLKYQPYKNIRLADVSPGTVIQVNLNANNEIRDMRVIYDKDKFVGQSWAMNLDRDTGIVVDNTAYYIANNYYEFGKVVDYVEGRVIYSNANMLLPLGVSDSTEIIIVDYTLSKPEVRLGYGTEIEKGDHIMIKFANLYASNIICYKGIN